MPTSVAELNERLKPDPWRAEVGFNNDIVAANEWLFNPAASQADHIVAPE